MADKLMVKMMAPLPADRIAAIVKRYKPRGWRVKQDKRREKEMSGEAGEDTAGKPTIRVPPLRTLGSVYLFLHECGHVRMNHFSLKLPAHQEEYEAERWAEHIMHAEGLPVPRGLKERMQNYVRWQIKQDQAKGIPIVPVVARWSKAVV